MFGILLAFFGRTAARLSLKTVLVLVGVLGVGALILALWIQSNRLERSQEKITDLETEISGLKSAAVLTERLRQDNSDLTRRLNDLKDEIHAAESASQPLPDDILRILDRLHQPGPGASAPAR